MLMQGMLKGALDPLQVDITTLDHCLRCRSCEAHCPSGVAYGEIVAASYQWLYQLRPALRPKRLTPLLRAIERPEQLQRWSSLTQIYQHSGIQRLVRHSGMLPKGLRLLEDLLPAATPSPKAGFYPAAGREQQQVILFSGCLGREMEARTVHDAIQLLTRIGMGVHLPERVDCCGALHHQNGEQQQGLELHQRLAQQPVNPTDIEIVGLSSSCVAHYQEQLRKGSTTGPLISELTSFLSCHQGRLKQLSPFPHRVALHYPCSNRNLLKNPSQVESLLALIPAIEITPLPQQGCCGAGGTHMMTQPQHARQFANASIALIETHQCEILVSQNLSCTLHLQAELRRRGLLVEVCHPVSLLLRTLPPATQ